MIRSFRHKGLKNLFESGRSDKVNPRLVKKLRRLLARLNAAKERKDLSYPATTRLHELQGDLRGFLAINVTGNWRLVFRLVDGDIYDLDLVDYH